MLVSFTDRFPGTSLRDHAARFPSSVGDLTPPADGLLLEVETHARVNAGRWIADCPQEGCGGAEYVNLDDPRFFCCECRNAGYGHVPIAIVVPDEKLRSAVDEALTRRPVPATRNWTRAETVDGLLAENQSNGVT